MVPGLRRHEVREFYAVLLVFREEVFRVSAAPAGTSSARWAMRRAERMGMSSAHVLNLAFAAAAVWTYSRTGAHGSFPIAAYLFRQIDRWGEARV